jgi:rare lipoprotein A (peptidoglycan hydrolase)
MKKVLCIILFFTFACSKTSSGHNKKGAFNNYAQVNRAVKRDEIVSPIAVIKRKKTRRKKGNFSSIKSMQQYEIDESQISHKSMLSNAYADFNDIFNNGKYQGHYKVGNPYEIEGILYHPKEYDAYEEVGVGSWYGEEFAGKSTANGEIYNLNSFTAAHRTLPLPSVAKVTNMENGKAVVVRINDRGPFAKNRIIDLSKKAAEAIGYQNRGTSLVKVEYLEEESKELQKKLNLK